jgi:hypothetical protein
MQWRMTAILRAMATFAFFIPMRLTSFIPQARQAVRYKALQNTKSIPTCSRRNASAWRNPSSVSSGSQSSS